MSCVHTNRLANEKSPYLLQHAHNPVEWYPWGQEAFDKAKRENKPIFLSVGYSTCHWCHVMEKESFENESVAAIMNKHFINIKVDREERPDVDKIYMEFVQLSTGGGGWPMSVWLTPDLEPLVGATYFPPEDLRGMPGFKTILSHIATKWRDDKMSLKAQGTKLIEVLKRGTSRSVHDASIVERASQCAQACFQHYEDIFDGSLGGFGDAPKFPQPSIFEFLLHHYVFNDTKVGWKQSPAIKMISATLRAMWNGGIHDHISQGFHRYSTDSTWHVPHFEKMLYDQAQLTVTAAEIFKITKDDFYADFVRDILSYVLRDLSDPSGGFYSAEDADSAPTHGPNVSKREGAFCVWTHDEVKRLLGHEKVNDASLADLFSAYYNVVPGGNVDPSADPHGQLVDQNVLIIHNSLSSLADRYGVPFDVANSALAKARHILFEARAKRPKPHLDSKMIASWNGLMISGLFKAASALNSADFAARAEKGLQFIKSHLYDEQTNKLYRCCYLGPDQQVAQISQPVEAFSDDYANVICCLLDAYAYSFDDQHLKLAEQLQQKMDELFWNTSASLEQSPIGAYYQCSKSENLPVKLVDDYDGAEPCANSVSISNLLTLYHLTGDDRYQTRAKALLTFFGQKLRKMPFAMPRAVCGLLNFDSPSTQVVIVGKEASEETRKMLDVVRSTFIPFGAVVWLNESTDAYLLSRNQHFETLKLSISADKECAALVCTNFSCQLPVFSAQELKQRLEQH